MLAFSRCRLIELPFILTVREHAGHPRCRVKIEAGKCLAEICRLSSRRCLHPAPRTILCKLFEISMRSRCGAVQQEIVGANDWKILWAKVGRSLRVCGAQLQASA